MPKARRKPQVTTSRPTTIVMMATRNGIGGPSRRGVLPSPEARGLLGAVAWRHYLSAPGRRERLGDARHRAHRSVLRRRDDLLVGGCVAVAIRTQLGEAGLVRVHVGAEPLEEQHGAEGDRHAAA